MGNSYARESSGYVGLTMNIKRFQISFSVSFHGQNKWFHGVARRYSVYTRSFFFSFPSDPLRRPPILFKTMSELCGGPCRGSHLRLTIFSIKVEKIRARVRQMWHDTRRRGATSLFIKPQLSRSWCRCRVSENGIFLKRMLHRTRKCKQCSGENWRSRWSYIKSKYTRAVFKIELPTGRYKRTPLRVLTESQVSKSFGNFNPTTEKKKCGRVRNFHFRFCSAFCVRKF